MVQRNQNNKIKKFNKNGGKYMENENQWKVVLFGEGQSWEHKNLTYKQAQKIINDCPNEYVGYIVPMLPVIDF